MEKFGKKEKDLVKQGENWRWKRKNEKVTSKDVKNGKNNVRREKKKKGQKQKKI